MKEGFLLTDGTLVYIKVKRKDVSRANNTELHYRYTAEVKANHKSVTVPYHDYSTAFYYKGVLNRRGFLKAVKHIMQNPKVLEVLTLDQMFEIVDCIEKQGV